MPKLHTILSTDSQHFLVYGGAPGGRDVVHNVLKRWPGWRRLRQPGRIPELTGASSIGAACSIYRAPISPITAGHLSSWSGGTAWSPEAHEAAETAIKALTRAMGALNDPKPKRGFNPPSLRAPMTHQIQALNAIRELGSRVLLADDMGLGKSSVAAWAAYQYFGCRVPRGLVICPASVKFNWRNELWACLWREVFVQVIDGAAHERQAQVHDCFAWMNQHPHEGGFIVINYDLLIRMAELDSKGHLHPSRELSMLGEWAAGGALIVDESYYVKNRRTKRFKIIEEFFAPAVGGAEFRCLASGTPVRNLVDDLYSQVELLRPGTWTSYTDFCKRHLNMVPKQIHGPKARKVWEPVGGKNLDALNLVMNTLQIRRKKGDVLNLPPMMVTYPELQLEGPHLKVYRAMKEWALLELDQFDDDENIYQPQVAGAAQAAMRCEQIAQGFIGGVPEPVADKIPYKIAHKISGRPRELVFPDSPKFKWLIETIEVLWLQGCRPVVFGRFNGPLVYLRHKYEDDSFILHGGQTSKMKAEVVERYQAGERRLLLAQIRISEGWTVTTSQDELIIARDWSPAVNSQAMARLHRIGQKGTVNCQCPVVTNSVELRIHKTLESKEGDAERVLKNLTIGELKEML